MNGLKITELNPNLDRLARKRTKGAEAFKDIIEESLAQNKNGTIADSAISKVKEKYGIFAPDSSEVLAAKYCWRKKIRQTSETTELRIR